MTPSLVRSHNFNPLSPCGERLCQNDDAISATVYFNPLSPCGERRTCRLSAFILSIFQSTLPMRGETAKAHIRARRCSNFNPLSPCGERRSLRVVGDTAREISIHSPHAGRDMFKSIGDIINGLFQSTLPMRGETSKIDCAAAGITISIHSPHAGRDRLSCRIKR